jgi:hypothetical protein
MVLRVTDGERPAFQLRKGEEGLSVFVIDAVDPPLTEVVVLNAFRRGSHVIHQSITEIEAKNLVVVPIMGAEPLSPRLRDAHAEIRPGPAMGRSEFKRALTELE